MAGRRGADRLYKRSSDYYRRSDQRGSEGNIPPGGGTRGCAYFDNPSTSFLGRFHFLWFRRVLKLFSCFRYPKFRGKIVEVSS